MARVLLGITGGIAAYKACELARLLVKAGHEVVPVPTPGAETFVSRATFEALARHRAPDDLYPHLEQADLLVIAPLSANTLAKLATGAADNVLTQLALAYRGPVLVAPAMNTRMWEHSATKANVATLVERGVQLVGPAHGDLAEGEVGAGRMSEPATILEHVAAILAHQVETTLEGRSVLVTAGGTREPIDAVRFVGNRSSGRMGVAIAAEARRRGATVTLVGANLAVPPPHEVDVVEVTSAAELARETESRGDADIVVMAAAVADYRPAEPSERKHKKGQATWRLELEATDDILSGLGQRRRNGQVLVGFAADEGQAGIEAAREKRMAKQVNLLVFNDVSRDDVGFDSTHNELVIIGGTGERHVGRRTKEECAVAILDEVAALLESR